MHHLLRCQLPIMYTTLTINAVLALEHNVCPRFPTNKNLINPLKDLAIKRAAITLQTRYCKDTRQHSLLPPLPTHSHKRYTRATYTSRRLFFKLTRALLPIVLGGGVVAADGLAWDVQAVAARLAGARRHLPRSSDLACHGLHRRWPWGWGQVLPSD